MVDSLSKEKRSWNMSRIKSANTKPELIVRSLLHRMGYRFRLDGKISKRKYKKGVLPERPDIVLKNTKHYFLCMDVSGIGMRDANMLITQNQE